MPKQRQEKRSLVRKTGITSGWVRKYPDGGYGVVIYESEGLAKSLTYGCPDPFVLVKLVEVKP